MFKSEIVNRWIVLQQGENHSAIDEEPKFKRSAKLVKTSGPLDSPLRTRGLINPGTVQAIVHA
jgi:hypothetical protein